MRTDEFWIYCYQFQSLLTLSPTDGSFILRCGKVQRADPIGTLTELSA